MAYLEVYKYNPIQKREEKKKVRVGKYSLEVDQFLDKELAQLYKCEMCNRVSYCPVISNCGCRYCKDGFC